MSEDQFVCCVLTTSVQHCSNKHPVIYGGFVKLKKSGNILHDVCRYNMPPSHNRSDLIPTCEKRRPRERTLTHTTPLQAADAAVLPAHHGPHGDLPVHRRLVHAVAHAKVGVVWSEREHGRRCLRLVVV